MDKNMSLKSQYIDIEFLLNILYNIYIKTNFKIR